MSLRGQDGYAMAALLVSMAIMAVLMSVALPVWRHDAQREKEEELVWRGQQYIRAIRLYQMKNQTLPPSVDVLVQGRYIRRKFKDPITNDDFVPIPAAGSIPGQGGQTIGGAVGQQPGPGRGGPAPAGRGVGAPAGGFTSPTSSFQSAFDGTTGGGMVPGGMTGVMSKSKEESIRVYQGRTRYNEWTFVFAGMAGAPGGPGGRGQPGGPGGVGAPGPGGRGRGGRGDTLSPGGRGTFPPGGMGGMRGVFPPGGGRRNQ